MLQNNIICQNSFVQMQNADRWRHKLVDVRTLKSVVLQYISDVRKKLWKYHELSSLNTLRWSNAFFSCKVSIWVALTVFSCYFNVRQCANIFSSNPQNFMYVSGKSTVSYSFNNEWQPLTSMVRFSSLHISILSF